MNFGDWAENFFTGDWTNAYEESPMLTIGLPALLATGGLGAAGIGPLSGLFGGAEAAAGLGGAEAAGGGFLADLFGGTGLAEGTAAGIGEGLAAGGGEAATALGAGFDPTLASAFTGLGEGSEVLGTAADAILQGGGSGTGTGAGGGFLSGLWEGAKSQVMKNPLGTGAAALGLGMNMFTGNPTDPNQQALQDKANQLGAQGDMLRSYLSTGKLPPALQAQLDQAKAAAKARLVSNAAQSGLPTDPNQNSALAAGLNAIDINAVSAMADSQIKMLQTGLTETGLSNQLYEMLVRMDRQNNQDLMTAIANFASALGGGGTMKKAA